jgi:hypothetical protein
MEVRAGHVIEKLNTEMIGNEVIPARRPKYLVERLKSDIVSQTIQRLVFLLMPLRR